MFLFDSHFDEDEAPRWQMGEADLPGHQRQQADDLPPYGSERRRRAEERQFADSAFSEPQALG